MSVSATFLADFTSFNSAVDKATSTLKSFNSDTKNVETALNRMANSFSGQSILQQATLATKAIDDLGGVASLTEKEQARLNAMLVEAIAKYAALGQVAPQAMLDLEAATRKTEESTMSVGERVIALGGALVAAKEAAGALVSQLGDWLHASSEQEDAIVRMNTALRAQGTYTPELSQQFQDLGSQFQKTTVYGDELVENMEALLTQIGNVAPKDMKAALTASTDLAAGLRIDLNSATTLVAKALEGNIGSLKRYGITIDESKLKTEGAAAVFDAIADKMGGQATEQAKTFSGQMSKLGNIVGDVKETLGGFLSGAILPLTNGFVNLPEPIRTAITTVGLLAGAVGAATAAVTALGVAAKVALPLIGVDGAVATTAMATATGALTSALGYLLPAVAVAGTAIAAWQFGSWIGDITGLTEAVATYTEKLYGMSDAEIQASASAREQASAMQDLAPLIEKAQAGADKALEGLNQHVESVDAATHGWAMSMTEANKIGAELDAQIKKMADALAEMRSAGVGWQGTLETMNGDVVNAVRGYLEAGVAQDKLATAYGLTAVQVKAVASFMADQVKQQKLADQAIAITTQLLDEYDQLRVAHGGTATDAQIAQIDRWAADVKARMQAAKADTQEFYDALEALSNEKKQSLLVDWDAIGKGSREALQQTADKADATFQYVLAHTDQFTAEQIAQFWRASEEARKAADEWGLSFSSTIDAVRQKSKEAAGDFVTTWSQAMDQVSAGLGSLGGSFDNPYALDPNSTPEEQAARAASLGGVVRHDDYGNPYVYVAGRNAPGRKDGGPVAAGRPYWVGEEGKPELFVPNESGTIIPTGAAAGSGHQVTVHVDASNSFYDTPDGIQRLADKVGDAVIGRILSIGGRV